MIRIGLVGEDPHDTSSIKNLLEKKYKDKIHFFALVKRIKGWHLDTNKINKVLPIEFADKKCHFIIYIRDLDGFKSEKDKVKKRKEWFHTIDSLVNNQGILLLAIWELEALFFADITTINSHYKIKYKSNRDPMMIKEPKEELMRITAHTNKEYKEAHSPDLFKKLEIDTLIKKCSFFKDFIKELETKL